MMVGTQNLPNTRRISKRCGGGWALHPRSARDFLDALVSLKFLERRNGRYYNTPNTDFFLDKRKTSYC
jgi:hypothetical protein